MRKLTQILAFTPVWLVGGLLMMPLVTLVIYALGGDLWPQLPLFSVYIVNSLILLAGTGIAAGVLGVSLAVLVSFYRFPLSRMMRWALFLPFSMPSYIIAYRMQDFTDVSGPVQSLMRHWWGMAWLPDARSLPGLMILFTLVLYPYVYLLTYSSLRKHTYASVEAARVMGLPYLRAVMKSALPLCWPAIVAGVSLVLIETLNEYGAVALSSVPTLSVGIVDLWWSLGDAGASAQLSLMVLLLLALFAAFEHYGRGQKRFYAAKPRPLSDTALPVLHGIKAAAALCLCLLPILFGFLLPLVLLIADIAGALSIDRLAIDWKPYTHALMHSITLALIAASLAVGLGVICGYILRRGSASRVIVRLIQLGYALPGALLAVGLILSVSALTTVINRIGQDFFGIEFNIYLSGSAALLVLAYLCRFSHISISGIDSQMQRVSPTLDEAASTLGRSPMRILQKIHLPLIDSGILAAFLLILVDVLKELPASLLLRPLNFDTLAVHVFEYAADERIEQAAPGALIIVLAGLFPVIYLSHLMDRRT